MRTMQETRDLAQSIIDTYIDTPSFTEIIDTDGHDLLMETASIYGQMLDNVIHMKWFRDALADHIASHEGVKGK